MAKWSFVARTRNYLVAGTLTMVPVWITWLVFEFFLRQLSELGRPAVQVLSLLFQEPAPHVARWLLDSRFQSVVAVVLTLAALYVLGWLAARVIGRRLIGLFDYVMEHIPLVKAIYGSTKTLLAALQRKPEEVKRVVFIEFPAPPMRTIGFVTRTLTDPDTGRKLAAVYVPTTPNPTSGYLELVPVEQVISTDWTVDEAMSFIISGGAVAPDRRSGVAEPASTAPPESGL